MQSLDEIISVLDAHGQRATYGAVAQLVGQSPRSLLTGRDRTPQASWIVNHRTGLPTGYADDQVDPRLPSSGPVITTGPELRDWMASLSHATSAA